MSNATADTNLTWHAGDVTREDRSKLLNQKGAIVWMTGLSASGKSTIAVELEKLLLSRHKHAYRLDGDNIRMGMNKSPKDLQTLSAYPEEAAKRFGVGFSADD